MHTVALTTNNEIITLGVNANFALGRNTEWGGGMADVQDEDANSTSDCSVSNADLNPLEITPTPIPTSSFPVGTQFSSVVAGNSCSFALTTKGLVYGWGTFRVRN